MHFPFWLSVSHVRGRDDVMFIKKRGMIKHVHKGIVYGLLHKSMSKSGLWK